MTTFTRAYDLPLSRADESSSHYKLIFIYVRRRWEDNIKMDLGEIGIYGANWIQLAQDRVQWRAFVNTVMNLRGP